ncbi:hypothetical protein NQ314_008257 [Rhamnusium bicolor]|uniref:Uncharacterized protein n=1 Tax=Rhamnusium bicolor TaxID=1586634 RepID=A0AAV8YEB9_9CUCU|nr:hypothetical protein NQ314_008257 [Rhamnusium bicolor]
MTRVVQIRYHFNDIGATGCTFWQFACSKITAQVPPYRCAHLRGGFTGVQSAGILCLRSGEIQCVFVFYPRIFCGIFLKPHLVNCRRHITGKV